MTTRSNFLQSEINGAIKAAAAAGYTKTRMIKHPDGRLEIIAEFGAAPADGIADRDDLSPFEKWKVSGANKT